MAGATAALDVVMPRLSDSMEEGTIVAWLKKDGDTVAVGDEIVEIETDKATMPFEAEAAGVLEVLVQEGETVALGEVIARIGGGGEGGEPAAADRAGEPAAVPEAAPAPEPSSLPAAPAPIPAFGNGAGDRVKASPLARRIAKDLGVDLASLGGSGPGGRVIKKDVESAAANGGAATPAVPPSSPAGVSSVETAKGSVEVVELTKLQQTVARRMAESKATAPHFYLQAEIDMSAAVAGRKRLKESAKEGDTVPTYNDMVVKACALALREFPRANGAYKDGRIELYSRVNVGVAVAAQDALVVPTVFDADLKGLRRISTETRALAAKVREGQITPPELSGGTFTVSNLGMYGVSNFHAVINTPQAGILAVGELKAKPVVTESGEIEARQLMGVTLACDHRILYGADGAQFLARVRALLEEPLGLAL